MEITVIMNNLTELAFQLKKDFQLENPIQTNGFVVIYLGNMEQIAKFWDCPGIQDSWQL